MDFTINKYKTLIQSIIKNNISVYTIKDWIVKKPNSGIVLRHDVDRNPLNSLRIAELENKYNIQSTYYFRITKSSFNKSIIQQIAYLGHEIGYHYEDLSLAKGDYKKAIKLFEVNLRKIRNIAHVKTIAIHGRPLSPYDSRNLWNKYNYKDYDLRGEAFLSINYSDIYYFTDTGRSWSNNSVNIRDKVSGNLSANIETTDELIKFIKNNKNKKFAIVSHPERWASSKSGYINSYCFDSFVNFVKKIILLKTKIVKSNS